MTYHFRIVHMSLLWNKSNVLVKLSVNQFGVDQTSLKVIRIALFTVNMMWLLDNVSAYFIFQTLITLIVLVHPKFDWQFQVSFFALCRITFADSKLAIFQQLCIFFGKSCDTAMCEVAFVCEWLFFVISLNSLFELCFFCVQYGLVFFY